MLTYTGRRNLFGSLTNDSTTANLTLGDTLLMDAEREIVSKRPWSFLETSSTTSTVASTQFYNIPNEAERLTSAPSVTVGSFRYVPKLCPTRQAWDELNMSNAVTTSYPLWYFVYNRQVGFYPTPSTSSGTITFFYRKRPIDLTKADYTTGTITTIAAGGTAVTGSGTSWADGMVGEYIRITSSTAANVGDGQWYEITAVGSTTTLTIGRAYQGTAIAAGSAAYTIGQPSALPEAFDILPVYKAVEIYFSSIQPEARQAALYKRLYDERYASMLEAEQSKTDDPSIDSIEGYVGINPNNYVSL